MSTREFCVYNETRENLLTPRVTVLDTRTDPLKTLKILIEGLPPGASTGLWLNPLKSVPTVPRLSAYDLVYLDDEARVVHHLELSPDDEVTPFAGSAASVLLLPLHTLAAYRLQPGDCLVVRPSGDRPSPKPQPLALPAETGRPTAAASPAKQPARRWPLLPPVTPAIQVQPPAPATRRFEFLHSFARLRIHIQVSVTRTLPVQAPLAAPGPAPVPVPARVKQHALRLKLSRLRIAAFASLHARSAQWASFVRRLCGSLGALYLRWAEIFVFGHTQSRPARRLPRLRRFILDSFFPR
jgi:hypothetical protein